MKKRTNLKKRMKIVVLDGHTLNPGDLSWAELEALGDCEIYDATSGNDLAGRCRDAEAVITNKVVLDGQLMAQSPDLRYIGVTATGYNIVDVEAAAKRQITVTNVPIYGTRSVAQMVFALLLELCHHVGYHSGTVCEGKWSKSKDFCYWDYPLIELEGLVMGVVAYGRIGEATSDLAKAFGMDVLAYDVNPARAKAEDVQFVELDELFARSDVVSLHCPLTAENEKMVNSGRLGKMKKTAFLINTARGQLVNEQDLADALNSGRIAGAGLDVLSIEPPSANNPLLHAKNCCITPHIAWATRAARKRLLDTAIENLRVFMEENPQNVVPGTV